MSTDSAEFFARHLAVFPVLGIFRGASPEQTVALCELAWASGVQLVEIPVQSPKAMPALVAAISAADGRPVGAGTVTTFEQLSAVSAAGAAFTVAPGLDAEIALESSKLGIPHLPGVATSTEITAAVGLGFSWLKAFPAAQLGAGWITAQHGPFPDVHFVATGGMDAGNAVQFLAAGCAAVAVGSAFSQPESASKLVEQVHGWVARA